ncbi:proton-coupled folate transporter-like [Dreissena polymorpha]|uniref:proton-coupled folate transporter-like n=1 Tax=Dreissena polymorpha TaxID=45954 RepID=UPI002264083D|nr:proton-coupled folate transporter-like [Dreissena polymorpha]
MDSSERDALLQHRVAAGVSSSSVRETPNEFRIVHAVLFPVTILLHVSGGISYYATQQWIQKYLIETMDLNDGHEKHDHHHMRCLQDGNSTEGNFTRIEQETARWAMFAALATLVPSFFVSALVSSYSDKYGRKCLFIISALSQTVQMAITSLTIYFQWSLVMIVVGSAIDGLSGASNTNYLAAMLYLADVTPTEKNRAIALSIYDGLLMFCSTLSAFSSGFIITKAGFFPSMVACTAAAGFCLLLICFCLPETHKRHNRATTRTVCKMIRRIGDVYCSPMFNGRRVAFVIVLVTYFFQSFANADRGSTELLYQLGRPFCWTAHKIGLFSAARHATQGLASMVLIIPLKRYLSVVNIALISAVFNTGSYVLEALATTTIQLFMVPIVATLGALATTMLKALLSAKVPYSRILS